MTRKLGHRLCDRCADTITNYCPTVETLAVIGAFHEQGEQAVVDEIVRREGIDPAIVWEYFRHRMIPVFKQRIAICSFCGGQPKTSTTSDKMGSQASRFSAGHRQPLRKKLHGYHNVCGKTNDLS